MKESWQSVYGSLITVKTFLEMLVGVLANPAGNALTFAQVALGSAAFTETFAQAAQVSRHLPRRLRRPRKFRGICLDVCAGRASSAAFAETFAQAAQVPRHLPRRLRKLRKFRGICRDVCASRASPAAFAETFAQVAQASHAQLLRFTTTLQIQKPNTLRVIQKMSTSRKYARMANGLWMEGRREAPGRMML